MNRVQQEPGYVLHRRDYRETSLLLELFTPTYGRVGMIARGARRSRRGRAGLLQPFQPLLFSWAGGGELVVLSEVDLHDDVPGLSREQLPWGFYCNELLIRLLPRDDPHPGLYARYHQVLHELKRGELALRRFEVALLEELGYGLELTCEWDTGRALDADGFYRYELERGPSAVADASDSPWVVSGSTLLGLAGGDLPDSRRRREGRRLLNRILAHYLGDRPIRSRELLKKNWRR